MDRIEIVFESDKALIVTISEGDVENVKETKYLSALKWMARQGKAWEWSKLDNGCEIAVWDKSRG